MSATLQKAASAQTVQQKEERAAYIAALGFPILVIIGGLVGFAAPSVVLPLKGWVNLLLGVVMFGMGLTLKRQISCWLPNVRYLFLSVSFRSMWSCRCLP